MQELTDDQLDGLFRKSAEEFEPEFDAAAWQAMQQQLNDRDKSLFWGKLLRWGIPAMVLLLVTGGSWYLYENRSPTPTPTLNSVAGVNREVALEKRDENQASYSAKTPRKQSLPAQSVDAQLEVPPGQATRSNSSVEDVSRIEGVTKPTVRKGSVAVQRPGVATAIVTSAPVAFAASVARSTKPIRSRRGKPRQTTADETSAQTEAVVVDYQNTVASRPNDGSLNPDPLMPQTVLPVTLPGLDTLANKQARWPLADALLRHEVAQPVIDVPTPVPSVPQRGFSVRLLVSPDLSSVGLKDFQRPGTNVGALLEYQFATRWRVQAGVLRSVKIYESPAGRYEWGSNTWPVQPESVYGRCNMLDIPLNLRYDFALRPRPDGRQKRWFVSGGVTTYVMLREDYTYNYTNPDDSRINPKAREWTTNTGGYGFSHLNVSFGYERAFSKRLSWQIEPFLKAPLKGVGYYKLNLVSTGAFFSLRYKLR